MVTASTTSFLFTSAGKTSQYDEIKDVDDICDLMLI